MSNHNGKPTNGHDATKVSLAVAVGCSRQSVYNFQKRGAPLDQGPLALARWWILNRSHGEVLENATALVKLAEHLARVDSSVAALFTAIDSAQALIDANPSAHDDAAVELFGTLQDMALAVLIRFPSRRHHLMGNAAALIEFEDSLHSLQLLD